MSGTTLATINALSVTDITTSGTGAIDIVGAGILAGLDIHGPAGTPITVGVNQVAGIGVGITTGIYDNATEIVQSGVDLGILGGFDIGGDVTGVSLLGGPTIATVGNGTLELGSGISVSVLQNIDFIGSNNDLIIDGTNSSTLALLSGIHGFGITGSDTIDLKGVTGATQVVWNQNGGGAAGGTALLENAGSTVLGSIVLADGTYTSGQFNVGSDGSGGVDIVVCFLEGTRIETPSGAVAVEALKPGQLVLTGSGVSRPVTWVGSRTLDAARHPRPEAIWPVRIAPGAIADGVPARPLYLSPDHAVALDGVLVPAKALVNGRSIVQERRASFTYHHVELEVHDVILAEGAPVESYLDTGNRGFFAREGAPAALHPALGQALRGEGSCAPLVESGPELAAIRARLFARLPALAVSPEAGIAVRAGGVPLRAEAADGFSYTVRLPETAADLVLASNSFVPALMSAEAEDWRALGLDIASLAVDGVEIGLADPRLAQGWHGAEGAHRWTDGAAVLPAALLAGGRVLTIRLASRPAYPVAAEALRRAG